MQRLLSPATSLLTFCFLLVTAPTSGGGQLQPLNCPSFLYLGNPFPLSFTLVPFWVPGATLSFTFPSKVSTWISPPSTAEYRSRSWVLYRSDPSRRNPVLLRMLKVIYRSPLGPP